MQFCITYNFPRIENVGSAWLLQQRITRTAIQRVIGNLVAGSRSTIREKNSGVVQKIGFSGRLHDTYLCFTVMEIAIYAPLALLTIQPVCMTRNCVSPSSKWPFMHR